MNKLIIAGALLSLTGCNTVGGLGKDLQQAGAVITGTASGVQAAATPGRAPPPPAPIVPAPGSTTPTRCEPDTNGLVLDGCPQPLSPPQ
jgi:predicted small secreted protein